MAFFEAAGDAAATARAIAAATLPRWYRDLDFAAVAEWLERGVELARSAGPTSDRIRAGLLSQLALFQFKLGDFDGAISKLDEALVAAHN